MMELMKRERRMRKSEAVRELVQETRLHAADLVQPLFVIEGKGKRETISSLPGIERFSIDLLLQEVEKLAEMGLRSVALFPVLDGAKKDSLGSEALNAEGLVYEALRRVKDHFPEMIVIADIALDPFTDHGHDGLVNAKGEILNDETVAVLAQMAVLATQAGADMVAPSDMMDGRVRAIRRALDEAGHTHTMILSYAAKYASALYGPFREAVQAKLAFGDKRSYQMNPANCREALRECRWDEEEGADILMIKPALSYLDIIAKVRQASALPIAAYHVSGEYSMVMAAGEKGWLNTDKVLFEHLLSIKRAGADIIFTYAAKRILPLL
jgi:porphobilinogen synthase